MATSGSSNWTQNRNDIIQQVLEILNIIGVGDVPSSKLVSMVSTPLNQYVKHIQKTSPVKLWKLEPLTKTFSAASEVTGTDSNIYTCIKGHTSSSDNKPVTGANYSTYWAQRGSTGGTWVTSTAYTSTGEFTDSTNDLIGIESAFLRQAGVDLPIEIIGRKEYMEISNKSDEGTPTCLYFDNKISPTIFIHPQLEDTDDVLHYHGIVRIEDFDNEKNNPDFPVEWFLALVWNVAKMLIIKGDLTDSEKRDIKNNAREYLVEARAGSMEEVRELEFEPDLTGYY
jgi:hypothetical protein